MVDFAGDSPDGRGVGTVRVGKGVNPSAEYIDCCGKSFVKRSRAVIVSSLGIRLTWVCLPRITDHADDVAKCVLRILLLLVH